MIYQNMLHRYRYTLNNEVNKYNFNHGWELDIYTPEIANAIFSLPDELAKEYWRSLREKCAHLEYVDKLLEEIEDIFLRKTN